MFCEEVWDEAASAAATKRDVNQSCMHSSGPEKQPLQSTVPALTVDFDAVFGNKETSSNDGPQPAAGKALSVQTLGLIFGFGGSTRAALN